METDNRKLTLLDLASFVAANAVGIIGAISIFNSDHNENFTLNRVLPISFGEWKLSLYYLYNWLFILSPIGISWTVTLSLLALRRPRPSIGQLADWPGVSACWMASLALAISCGLFMGDEYRRGNYGWEILGKIRPDPEDFADQALPDLVARYVEQANRPIACSVGAFWAIAALGRRWSPRRNWLDRAGISLGVTWLLYVIIEAIEQPL